MLKNEDAARAVMAIEGDKERPCHHGVSVATLAIGIAQSLKLNESHPLLVNQLALGCMIHDLEHHFTGVPLNLKGSEMALQDQATYLQHQKKEERIDDSGRIKRNFGQRDG